MNSQHGRAALAQTLETSAPSWGVAFVQESDFYLKDFPTDNSLQTDKHAAYSYVRHWPGHGSFAQLVLIRNTSIPYVGRSGGRADAAPSCISRSLAELSRRKTLPTLPFSLWGFALRQVPTWSDILQDLSKIWIFVHQRSHFVAVGDWNLDAAVSVMHLSPPTEAH
jgi:hypothetical protein